MREIKVESAAPVRLDNYLQKLFPAMGIGRWNRALRENKIKLNGKKQPLSTRVQTGDVIRLFVPDAQLGEGTPEGPVFLRARCPAEVAYEDDQLLVCVKPAGLAVYGDEADTLLNRALLYLYQSGFYRPDDAFTPFLCHRLDTGTSGLVMVAKTAAALAKMEDLIRRRAVKKEYLCVTFGRPKPPAGTLGGYLQKDAARGVVRILSSPRADAKPVETRYETMAVSGRLALLKVELITGRTHQIRAHMASIGCPILGDSKYGNQSANRELKLKYQALCAWQLTFPVMDEPEFAALSGHVIRAPLPWYAEQVQNQTLR